MMSPQWRCGGFSKAEAAGLVCPGPNKCVPTVLHSLYGQVALSSSAAKTVLALSFLGHATLGPTFLGCTLWWLQMHSQDGSLRAF